MSRMKYASHLGNTLIIGQSKALWISHDLNESLLIATPDDISHLLPKKKDIYHPLRIMLAGTHTAIATTLPPLSWWEQQRLLRQYKNHKIKRDHWLFFDVLKSQRLCGFNVSHDSYFFAWMQALIDQAVPVQGLYSLVFELCRSLTTPTLIATLTFENTLRFIFTDGNGRYLHRVIPYHNEVIAHQEIERTIYYISRKYNLELNTITVISTCAHPGIADYVHHWNTLVEPISRPETFLLAIINNSRRRLQKRYYLPLARTWRLFYWPRLFMILGIPILFIFIIVAISLWGVNQKLARDIAELDESTSQIELQIDNNFMINNEDRLLYLITLTTTYEKICHQHHSLLKTLIKLRSPDEAVHIKQLMVLRQHQDAQYTQKLIIEYAVHDKSLTLNDKHAALRKYYDYLCQQFPQTVHDFNEDSLDTESDDGSLPQTATIQISDIK